MTYLLEKFTMQQHYMTLGIIALCFWSTTSTCLNFTSPLPSFELLCLIFTSAFIFSLLIFLRNPDIHTLKAPVQTWVALFSSVILQAGLYVAAIQRSPPAEVDMLFYLWPIIAILGFSYINKARPKAYQILSSFFGLTAVALIFNTTEVFNVVSLGHFLAFLSSLICGIFCVYVGKLPKIHPNMIGLMIGAGALIFAAIHILTEDFIPPNAQDICATMYYGIFIIFGANTFWTISQQKKPCATLALLGYVKPAIALSLLALFGFTAPTQRFFLGIGCILLSALFCNGYPWHMIKRRKIAPTTTCG